MATKEKYEVVAPAVSQEIIEEVHEIIKGRLFEDKRLKHLKPAVRPISKDDPTYTEHEGFEVVVECSSSHEAEMVSEALGGAIAYHVVVIDGEGNRRIKEVEKPTIENVKQCLYCSGAIDRYEHLFQCRECGSIGDLVTGIMNPPHSAGGGF